MKKILVTGGAGFIGTHTCVELLNAGYDVVVMDNFSNSNIEALEKVKQITNKDFKFYEIDMKDKEKIEQIFIENDIEAVIDFAAYKAVGESVKKPIEYYMNNVGTVLNLLEVMQKYNVKKIVFSSTATVYGVPDKSPVPEEARIGDTTNPYSTSKYMVERILQDLYRSDNTWNICVLRYFNPIGAHKSGLIGEKPNGIPANLMPYIAKVASGELKELSVFGDDYKTKDGTGVRDYIHVVDLAQGHIKAIDKITKEENNGIYLVYNLGTGVGYSVYDIINTFEKVNDIKIPYKVVERRPGDIDIYYADPTKAKEELGFEAKLTLEDMCRDTWNFQKNLKK